MTSGDISLDYMNVEKVRGIAPDLFCSTKRVAEQVEKFVKAIKSRQNRRNYCFLSRRAS